MSNQQSLRPDYYEGQFVGAVDLDQAVDYARFQLARHGLGAHVWGIGIGLQLKEVPKLGDTDAVDVYVQPGFAVDGFGRQIVVREAYQIPPELLALCTEPRVMVWIRHHAQPTSPPREGFLACDEDPQFTRVDEGFRIVVGHRKHSEQHDEILVAGQSIDALEVLPQRKAADPLICDESIPYQTFPADGESQATWLVPLGCVRWDGVELISSDDEDRRWTRSRRRYLGVVAEEIEAADGLIRLRNRTSEPPSEETDPLSKACGLALSVEEGKDLVLADGDEGGEKKLHVEDLVWVEGNLRVVKADVKLFGGKLQLRDDVGSDSGVPMWIRRVDSSNSGPAQHDMQLLIGKSSNGPNRLTIGQVNLESSPPNVADLVVVQDDGKVGIGTTDLQLSKPLTVRAIHEAEGAQEVMGIQNAGGAMKWHVNLRTEDQLGLEFARSDDPNETKRFFLADDGNVGIGTAEPNAKLDVSSVPPAAYNTPLGSQKWFSVGNGGDSGRMWVQYGEQCAPLLVLSDKDNPPWIQFQQTGEDEDEAAPEYISTIGHARSNSNDIAIMAGKVGIGASHRPSELEVYGNIRLGSLGDLHALGAPQSLRVVAGRVAADGEIQSGSGFTVVKPPITNGIYYVTFLPAFSVAPVVVVSLIGSTDNNNVATIHGLSHSGFSASTTSIAFAGSVTWENTEFTFIAMGPS